MDEADQQQQRAGPRRDGTALVCQRLSGGLGNQLFQAAAAMALARRLGGRLAFDLRRYKAGALRKFELSPFPTGAEIWEPNLGARDFVQPSAVASRLLGRQPAPWGWHGRVYRQPHFGYDPAFETLAGDQYLFGVFQSELYFRGAADHVRRVFDCASHASDAARALSAGWAGEDRTSVHIRRGDYASDARNMAKIGVLDDAYYERAIALMTQIAPKTRLTFFSDDPAAAARLAERFPGSEVVRGKTAIDDLYLIGRCCHHINANSSFSWWGAWLGPGGTTIAPRQYLTPARLVTTNISDLFPVGWVIL